MTYEKFEHTVLKMLLAGNDQRLELLREQELDLEVLAREETEMGFTVRLMAPAPIAITESEGRIFGVEAKLSDTETINLELVLKNGLIDRLKGTFTSDMTYADVIRRGDELQFLYKNGESAELNFHADDYDTDEVTFVKNITTISQEIDAQIAHGEEVEEFEDDLETEDVVEVTEIDVQLEEEIITTEDLVIEEALEQEDVLVETVAEEKEEEFEVLIEEPQTLFPAEEIIDELPNELENEVEGIIMEPVSDIESGPFAEPAVDYDEVCDGKAPQGPASFNLEETDDLVLSADELKALAELDDFEDIDNLEDVAELFADEVVGPDVAEIIEQMIEADQTGRGTGVLDSVDDEDIDDAIEYLLKRNSAKRKDLAVVILITVIILTLIVWMLFF